MSLAYSYKPVQYFLITMTCTWVPWFIAAYFSHQKGKEKLQVFLTLPGLLVPAIVAIAMIYASHNQGLIKDFWHRLTLFKMDWPSLVMIFAIIPVTFFVATAISLLFGKSAEQFSPVNEFNVMQGWHLLSLLIPIVLAPFFEEVGWRGYGVDSLRQYFNLFNTCMLFAFLWAIWHVPLFFIKGYYHYELRNINFVYVINFFISMIPAAILINWVYYRNSRSIVVAVVAHSMLNALSMFFKTEQFTKCIFTFLLLAASLGVVLTDKNFFFELSPINF